VPSVSRNLARLALLAACGSLLLGAAAGCSTTQEKAAHAKARADHILEARAERQRHKKAADGSKGGSAGDESADRPRKGSSNE
jgi:hypothetical protein